MAGEALDVTASRFRDDKTPYLSARRVASLLGVTLTELAALAGVARNTLTAKTGARKVDIALSPVVRILTMASEMAGDDQRAAIWFKHQPPRRSRRSRSAPTYIGANGALFSIKAS
jgi:hypothetical protein